MKTKKITVVGIIAAFAIVGLLAFNAFGASADENEYQEQSEELAPEITEEGFTVEPMPEMTDEEMAELLEADAEMERHFTPLDYHLTEVEAKEIGIQWIYEEFGFEVEDIFSMRFIHEDSTGGVRSFWSGGAIVYSSDGSIWEHYYVFSIDGITGERVIITDEMQFEPVITDVILGDVELTVHDNTGAGLAMNPFQIAQIQPYHITLEDAVVLVTEVLHGKCGLNLDNQFVSVQFFTNYFAVPGTELWYVNIILDEGPDNEDRAGASIQITIDARVGEILEATFGDEYGVITIQDGSIPEESCVWL